MKSFSKLARLGVAYRNPKKTSKTKRQSKKKGKLVKIWEKDEAILASKNNNNDLIIDKKRSVLQDRINTVVEESDESFIDCSWDVNDEPVQRHSAAQYVPVNIRNPHSSSKNFIIYLLDQTSFIQSSHFKSVQEKENFDIEQLGVDEYNNGLNSITSNRTKTSNFKSFNYWVSNPSQSIMTIG